MEDIMDKYSENSFMQYYEKTFDELCVINSIIKLVKNSCLEREFSGQYYGIPQEKIIHISEERNNYINMLTLLAERVSNVMNLHLILENLETPLTEALQQSQQKDNNLEYHR